jgi:hypothetical protein
VATVDPFYKDEYTLGVDWAFHRDWVAQGKLVYWEQADMYQILNQLDDTGSAVTVVGNNPLSKIERSALHLGIQRRFKNGWRIAANYTYSKTEGNCLVQAHGIGCRDQFGEYLDVVDPDSGEPLSTLNRWGSLRTDLPHIFKVRGSYRLPLGRGHSLNLGGLFFVQDGAAWESITQPNIPGVGTITVYQEPAGSQRNPTQKQLNLNMEWDFPIVGRLEGTLRLEVVNATNQQVLNGTPNSLRLRGTLPNSNRQYQMPRFFRVLLGLTF